MGRTRRKLLPADMVRNLLAHWFGPSTEAFVEDLRHADRGAWDSEYGDYRVTKNGDPQRAEEISDTDGRAYAFNEGNTTDYLEIADGELPEPGDGPFSVGALLQTTDQSEPGRIAQKRDLSSSNEGWSLFKAGTNNDIVEFFLDDGTDSADANPSITIADGQPHLCGGVRDPGDARVRTFVDGVFDAQGATTGVGSVDNSTSTKVTVRDDLARPYIGDLGLFLYVLQWISEPQWAYLDALLRDRSLRVPTLPIYGHPATGLKRRLPSYLTDAFGAGGPDFWWSADRTFRHEDGEGVVQLTNHAGSDFGVQRTSSNQPFARGPSKRGQKLAYLEGTGGEYHTKLPAISSDEVTVFGVYKRGNTTTDAYGLFGDDDTNSRVRVRNGAHDRLQWDITDTDGVQSNGDVTLTNIDTANKFAFVCVVNTATGRLEAAAESALGNTDSETFTESFTGSLSAPNPAAMAWRDTLAFVGNQYMVGFDQTALSSTEQQTLLDELVQEYL